MPPSAEKPARPERPTRPALTRQYIIEMALAVIDRDGASSVSMRKLGAEIGVDPMALYHYVPSKAALFDGVVELLWSAAQPPEQGLPSAWPDEAAGAMRSFRGALLAHPRAASIVAGRPIVSPPALSLLDSWLGRLMADGLSSTEALDLINCLAAYTIGQVLAEAGEPMGGQDAAPEDIYRSLTPETHPHLFAALRDGYDFRAEEQYEAGLTALIAGWSSQR